MKSDNLKRKDQALATFTQGFKDQMDEARHDMKLVAENIFVITKAYEDLAGQAMGQFDAVVQAVMSLWPDLDMAWLVQALSHLTPQSLGMANVDPEFPTPSSRLLEVT